MSLKSWQEMYNLDLTGKTEQKEDLNKKGEFFEYLSWATCVKLLHENGAEKVWFEPIPGDDGQTLRMTLAEFEDKNGKKNRCYEVVVKIVIDDDELIYNYPVISGSSIIHDQTMNQQKINTAVERAFVKGVAIWTGLGLKLWEKNDETAEKNMIDDIALQDPMKLFKKIGNAFAQKIKQLDMSEEEIGVAIGISEKPGAVIKQLCVQLRDYEVKLNDLGKK